MGIPGIKNVLARQGYVLSGYNAIPDAFAAELYARQGWDAVAIDLQHGLMGYEKAVQILQSITALDVLPLARIPWLEASIPMKLLDAGAIGIICPMIGTAAQAAEFVSYCKYPPLGQRSSGPIRAKLVYGMSAGDYIATANSSVSAIAMVETVEGVENIEKIAAVEGLDGIYIGANDLALSMGLRRREEGRDPEVEAAIEHVLAVCKSRGLMAGINAANPEKAWATIARGFQFITLATDVIILSDQTRNWVRGVRDLARAGAAAASPKRTKKPS